MCLKYFRSTNDCPAPKFGPARARTTVRSLLGFPRKLGMRISNDELDSFDYGKDVAKHPLQRNKTMEEKKTEPSAGKCTKTYQPRADQKYECKRGLAIVHILLCIANSFDQTTAVYWKLVDETATYC